MCDRALRAYYWSAIIGQYKYEFRYSIGSQTYGTTYDCDECSGSYPWTLGCLVWLNNAGYSSIFDQSSCACLSVCGGNCDCNGCVRGFAKDADAPGLNSSTWKEVSIGQVRYYTWKCP